MFKILSNKIGTDLVYPQKQLFPFFISNYHWNATNSKPYIKPKEPNQNVSRLLPIPDKAPKIPPKMLQRRYRLTRGFCLPHEAELKRKQFGVITLDGGFIQHKHFVKIANTINKFIKNRNLAAEWRIEAPYHAVTRHPVQAVMGGGKGKIDHYVSLVKARQVVFELYGDAEYPEVYNILVAAANSLKLPARPVHYEMLKAMYEEEKEIEKQNENFFSFREIAVKNMQFSRSFLSPYDLKFYGKIR